ncbi:MAG: aminotransferase [Candidatus Aminicenantes bacterium]|nr:MAG: aminotransferase V [Candidatus Aminicenantes bacterium 4484_214]RLE04480.1 MAG: aminotransferase [Candidatus Aminicenantes bacterium]
MSQEKLLLIPGPTPVHPRIIHSLSLPTISHVSPDFVAEFKEALANLKKVVFTAEGQPFIIAGAGTLAMEIALLNTVSPEDRVLVLSQGYFGQRMKEILASFDLQGDIIQSPLGRAVTPEEMENKLAENNYAVVVSTHVDTATGACAPIRSYVEICKEYGTLFILDGVCATGGIEERLDDWGIDVVLTAAQKCFGVPPGLAILVFSPRAMVKRKNMAKIPAYYSDILRWLPVMKDPSKYFSTPCVNEIRAFNEGLRLVIEEGLPERFRRHAQTARAIRAALTTMGLSLFTQEAFLADTLSVILYPPEIKDKEFRQLLAENGVIVAGGLGELQGQVFRLGHMGNLSSSQVIFALEAIEKTLLALGYKLEKGRAIERAEQILSEKIH